MFSCLADYAVQQQYSVVGVVHPADSWRILKQRDWFGRRPVDLGMLPISFVSEAIEFEKGSVFYKRFFDVL